MAQLFFPTRHDIYDIYFFLLYCRHHIFGTLNILFSYKKLLLFYGENGRKLGIYKIQQKTENKKTFECHVTYCPRLIRLGAEFIICAS